MNELTPVGRALDIRRSSLCFIIQMRAETGEAWRRDGLMDRKNAYTTRRQTHDPSIVRPTGPPRIALDQARHRRAQAPTCCEPTMWTPISTVTPTPSTTPTATATPARTGLYLPLIFRQHTSGRARCERRPNSNPLDTGAYRAYDQGEGAAVKRLAMMPMKSFD